MGQWGWIVAGGAAATGILGMCWGYLRGIWAHLASYVVVTCRIEANLSGAVTMYCWRHHRPSRLGPRYYLGWVLFVRPQRREELIAMEAVGDAGKLFWRGWRPLRLKIADAGEKRHGETVLMLTFFRGTICLDEFLLAAVEEYNATRLGRLTEIERFFVKHVFGTDGKLQAAAAAVAPDAVEPGGASLDAKKNRILRWRPEEIGSCRLVRGKAIEQLALGREAAAMVADVDRWRQSEDWHKERGLPWRRGWLLHGLPGTGKTSLVRAVAQDFDLPIFVFHLGTLYDSELQRQWQMMKSHVPCIALIEDIDGVFAGRKNVAGGHLGFDCLLNCLDGVEQANGVLVVVTTNRLDRLDEALGRANGREGSSRPGRLDCILELGPLDEAGRRKLCRRILPARPDEWERLIVAGAGESGAQFQARCAGRATDIFWRAPRAVGGNGETKDVLTALTVGQ